MPRGRPRQFNPDKALEAALLLFWRHGYEGTSLDALTRAMKINVPSLYATFGNKEALFHKAIDLYLQKPGSYLRKALTKPTARAAVETLFKGAINMVMNPRHPDGCLLVHGALASGPAGAPIRKELAERRARAQAAIQRRLQRALDEGDLPPHTNPEKFARYLTTLLWGMSVQAAGGASRSHLQQIAKTALQHWPTNQPIKN